MSASAYTRVSDWLRFDGSGLVVTAGKVDIGQRISTALQQAVMDQTTLPPDSVAIDAVRTGESPDEGITSGSNSVATSGRTVMLAAATLREAALAVVVRDHGGEPGDWTLEDGTFRSRQSNASVRLLDIVEADVLDREIDPAVTLLPRSETTAWMRGIDEMVRGAYGFVHDIDVEGMLHARVLHPTHPRARDLVLPAEVTEGLEADGLRLVRDGSFLAVLGPDEWQVERAYARLLSGAEWTLDDGVEPGDIFDRLRPGAGLSLPVVDGVPDPEGEVARQPEAPDMTRRFERPFTLHGALAPSAAFAVFDGSKLAITCHSQGIYPLRDSIADSLNLSPDHVVITHRPGSGCYGHNGADDAAFEAALIATLCPDTPVLLKWSRADEHGYAPCATAQAVDIGAMLGPDGWPTELSVETIGGTFRGRPRPGDGRVGPSRLVANNHRVEPIPPQTPTPNLNRNGGLHRNLDPAYDVPSLRLVKTLVTDMPLRTSALRCLGATANVFALEGLVDDIARAAGNDPIGARISKLSDPRAIDVLERIGRLSPPDDGLTRGVAYARYKNEMAWLAAAVDLVVTEDARIDIDRIALVCDAGRVFDPEGTRAQLEGGALQAVSWALFEEAGWDETGITTQDWESYPVLRFDAVPEIEIELVDRPEEPPLGVGEAAPGPVVAAIGIAARQATGLPLYRLPFTADRIMQTALEI